MECEACGYEMTEDMNYCPGCGDFAAKGTVVGKSRDVVIKTTKPGVNLTSAQWELLGDFVCKFSEAGQEQNSDREEDSAEFGGDEFGADTERLEPCVFKVRELCRAFLTELEDWMDEHLEGTDYSKRSTALLIATKAEGEVSYVCCDLYGDSKAGYAITDEGFYYALPEAYEGVTVSGFSFEQLEEDDIRYEDGYLYICDDCVYLALSEWESQKLYELLKAIVHEYNEAQ